MKKILIIEDDPATIAGLEEALKAEHFIVTSVISGQMGYEKARSREYDLIILDLMLPDKNGKDICKDLRKDGMNKPILMLTAKKEEIDQLMGFEIGTDDYVTKPFSIRVLIARINSILKRSQEILSEVEEYSFSDVYMSFKKLEAKKTNIPIDLTKMEYDVMKYFVQHEGEVISRNRLLDEVWGYENFPSTRTVDNFILNLRKKIEDDYSSPKHLITVHKAGYKFLK